MAMISWQQLFRVFIFHAFASDSVHGIVSAEHGGWIESPQTQYHSRMQLGGTSSVPPVRFGYACSTLEIMVEFRILGA